jgi:hypothetical protein
MRVASMCRWIMMSAVALLLVPGSGAAQTTEVHFNGSNATGITNLDVGGTFWHNATDTDIRLFRNDETYAKFGLSTPVEAATWGRIKALYGN